MKWRKLFAEFRACWNLVLEYRLAVLIWMFTIVLPLIMLAVWLSIAERGPVAGYDRTRFISYYLAAFVVRNMTGMWFIWDLDHDMRIGDMSFRLLRPMNPAYHYMALALSSRPLRLLLLIPITATALILVPGLNWALDAVRIVLFVFSLVGSWMILFWMQYTIGLLGFWITRTVSVNEAWFFMFSLTSGYLIPLDLFPPAVREFLLYLPFRYTMSFPVELLTGRLGIAQILGGIGAQWIWIALIYGVYRVVWNRGLRRYSAVGA